ncbi:hypothetical protein Hanom_Chr12g01085341 [Helianthus anomalus]
MRIIIFLEGDHFQGKSVNPKEFDIYFFKSAEGNSGPNKRTSRIRPRRTKSAPNVLASPISLERPKRRLREDGVFSFDLNVRAEVNTDDDLGPESVENLHAGSQLELQPMNSILVEQQPVHVDGEEGDGSGSRSMEIGDTINIGNAIGVDRQPYRSG